MGCGSSGPASPPPTANGNAAQGTNGGVVVPSSAGHRLRALGPWVYEGGAISQFQLQCMREEFWAKAQASGHNTQAWDALKVACEAMANGDQELAETVLQSSGIATANGSLSVCFDHHHHKFEIPRFCWCTPVNLRDGVVDALGGKTEEGGEASPLPIAVRVAFTEVLLKFDEGFTTRSTIGDLKAAVHERMREKAENVDDPVSDPLEVSRQRMFFGGRELRDKYTLAACGLKKNYVAQVTGKPTEAEQKAFIERYS